MISACVMNRPSSAVRAQHLSAIVSKFFFFSRLNKKSHFGQEKLPWYKKFFFGPKTLKIFLLGLIVFVGLAYIVQVNMNATSGYQVTELAEKAQELQKINKKLEIQAASLRSIENIERVRERQVLEKVTYIEYIAAEKPAVALGQ